MLSNIPTRTPSFRTSPSNPAKSDLEGVVVLHGRGHREGRLAGARLVHFVQRGSVTVRGPELMS